VLRQERSQLLKGKSVIYTCQDGKIRFPTEP